MIFFLFQFALIFVNLFLSFILLCPSPMGFLIFLMFDSIESLFFFNETILGYSIAFLNSRIFSGYVLRYVSNLLLLSAQETGGTSGSISLAALSLNRGPFSKQMALGFFWKRLVGEEDGKRGVWVCCHGSACSSAPWGLLGLPWWVSCARALRVPGQSPI